MGMQILSSSISLPRIGTENCIQALQTHEGTCILYRNDTIHFTTSYSNELFTTHLYQSHIFTTKVGPVEIKEDHPLLSSLSTMEETKSMAFSFHPFKDPGPDGLRSFFC